jgi:hypothetical protein
LFVVELWVKPAEDAVDLLHRLALIAVRLTAVSVAVISPGTVIIG